MSFSFTRRHFIRAGGLAFAAASLARGARAEIDTSEGVSFADGPRPLVSYPGKRPLKGVGKGRRVARRQAGGF